MNLVDWGVPLFLALKAQFVVFVSAFVVVSILVSLLFAVLLLTVPPRAQPFVKVGARAPRAPWSRRHCTNSFIELLIGQQNNLPTDKPTRGQSSRGLVNSITD